MHSIHIAPAHFRAWLVRRRASTKAAERLAAVNISVYLSCDCLYILEFVCCGAEAEERWGVRGVNVSVVSVYLLAGDWACRPQCWFVMDVMGLGVQDLISAKS